MDLLDRLWSRSRHLLDLDAALRRGHEEDSSRRAIQDAGEVELGGDIGRGRDEHPAHRRALDVHAQDLRRDALRLVRRRRELHPARLATAADQHLGLDHDLARRAGKETFGGGTGRGKILGDGVVGNGQSVSEQEPLGVVLLQLHCWRL